MPETILRFLEIQKCFTSSVTDTTKKDLSETPLSGYFQPDLLGNAMSVCLYPAWAFIYQLSPAHFEPSTQRQCNLIEVKKPLLIQRIRRYHGVGRIRRAVEKWRYCRGNCTAMEAKNSDGPKSTGNQLRYICHLGFGTNSSLSTTKLQLENWEG